MIHPLENPYIYIFLVVNLYYSYYIFPNMVFLWHQVFSYYAYLFFRGFYFLS
jgi:hypothetical protein